MDALSRREAEIARAYADGASHRAIGEKLFIAPSTVRTHVATIYQKLGVSSKLELARALGSLGGAAPADAPAAAGEHRRALAIMPFRAQQPAERTVAAGLVQDVITRISKLRCIHVIARGTCFALDERGVRGREAAELLGVDYLASGELTRVGGALRVSVELSDCSRDEAIWAESFEFPADETLLALERIGDSIVGAVTAGIEMAERNRALLKSPQSLDAWESFHRGVWHMFRFTAAHNARAQELFRRSVTLDPTFARAHAGLSFTHFQNAFLLRPEHREDEVARALEAAGESIIADNRDPTAHWALGRALWLKGENGEAAAALDASVELSPNFAMGHYSLAFVNSQSGNPEDAIRSADQSHRLSPFDPLLFGFLGARAMALFRLGDYGQAADAALRAAARPNAHVHIQAIAALCLAGAGRLEEGRRKVADIRAVSPSYGCDDFLVAFRFPPADGVAFSRAAARIAFT